MVQADGSMRGGVEEKVPTLSDIVKQAAADADKQFEGQGHVADAQIDAAANAASRRVMQQAQSATVDGLAASIRAAMKTKARIPAPAK